MSAPLLQVEHLSRSFGRRGLFGAPNRVRAVDDVSFTIGSGETLGLVGESGSGKSTLARLCCGCCGRIAGGSCWTAPMWPPCPTGAVRALRRDMQMVFQDPYGSLDPRMTAGATIGEPMRVHGVTSRPSV